MDSFKKLNIKDKEKSKVTTKSIKKNESYIKKVILENFLSFRRDDVDFGNARFIIIVGPNASGKTSIFQAIKFALGSNERDERYRKWSDFIRNNQNHAMVELHIQAAEELIKIRRFVLRGQSPYYTIKRENDSDFVKISAFEIQKLISELKYNPDNRFAFVSQGKIDAIKSLKPTELCSFLEEGIGLKGLREEILQQKNSVLNLNTELKSLISKKNVLNISLDLLQPKIHRLKEKKKLLKIKEKYNDELLWANRKKLEYDIKNLERLILQIQVVIDEINKKKENIGKEIKELQIKISEIEKKVNDLLKNLGEKNYKKHELISKIQTWQSKKIAIKLELDTLAEKISSEDKILDNYNNQKSAIDNELKIIKKEKNIIEQKINDLIKEQSELTKKIQLNEQFLEEYNRVVSEKKDKIKQISENKKLIKSLNNEIEQIFQSFQDIEHKLEINKWFLENPTKNLLSELDKELKKTSLEQFSLESNIKELEREKFKRINKLKPLQTSLRERRIFLPTNITILKEEINKRELSVKGPIIEYLKYDDNLSYAIESVLGEKLLYSFIADNWDTLDLLKRLKEKYNAYCNIYVPKNLNISPFPKLSAPGVKGYLAELINVVNDDIDIKKIVYSKIKDCVVVSDFRSGKELYTKYNFNRKCVTLKGEQIVSYKYAYETPHIKQLKGLLSAGTQKEQSKVLESEINELNNAVLEKKAELSKLDQIQKELFNKKESFNDLLYIFNQKNRLTSKKNEIYEQRTNLESINEELNKEINDLEIKIKNLENQKDPEFFQWNKRIKEIPDELNYLNNEEKKKWDDKLNENENILKDVQEKVRIQKEKFNELKQEFRTKEENFKKEDKDAFDTYRELENVEEEINTIEGKMLKFNEEKNKIQEIKAEHDKKDIQATLDLDQQNIKFNSTKLELNAKKEDLERINVQIGPLVFENKIEIRPIEEIREDILKIDKELLKFLDVDESILVERDQIMDGLKEIVKNQKNLENDIGAAIETENKLEDTYYEKFQNVLNDLKSMINQKFENANVKSYCSLMLEGDFQNLGVVIKAAMSKEQLNSFSALSGGQISMICICLILSLQEMNPSPLCMLDEAAMFLDENNSEIVYKMIKTMLEQNPIQMLLFLPQSSNILYLLAEKLIGIARVGKNEISTVFEPKIVKKE